MLRRCVPHKIQSIKLLQQCNNSHVVSLAKSTYNLNFTSPSVPLEFINSYTENPKELRLKAIQELTNTMKTDKE